MHLSHLLLLPLCPLTALAALNGHCSGTATGDYLSTGICVSTSTCDTFHGSYISGGCPSDGNSIKCCLVGLAASAAVNPCGGISWCKWTAQGCTDSGGTWVAGKCPGGNNYKCCRR